MDRVAPPAVAVRTAPRSSGESSPRTSAVATTNSTSETTSQVSDQELPYSSRTSARPNTATSREAQP